MAIIRLLPTQTQTMNMNLRLGWIQPNTQSNPAVRLAGQVPDAWCQEPGTKSGTMQLKTKTGIQVNINIRLELPKRMPLLRWKLLFRCGLIPSPMKSNHILPAVRVVLHANHEDLLHIAELKRLIGRCLGSTREAAHRDVARS